MVVSNQRIKKNISEILVRIHISGTSFLIHWFESKKQEFFGYLGLNKESRNRYFESLIRTKKSKLFLWCFANLWSIVCTIYKYLLVTGLHGTEGWAAPEVFSRDSKSVTPAVDIFSLGCVYYFCLSDGKHPYGSEFFMRQARIHQGNFWLVNLYFDSKILQAATNWMALILLSLSSSVGWSNQNRMIVSQLTVCWVRPCSGKKKRFCDFYLKCPIG